MLKLFNRKKKDNKGFTLVELVVVIAILAILVGLLAPQYTKYVEKSRKSADATNVENVITAIKVASSDEEYNLPAGTYTVTLTKTGMTVTGPTNTLKADKSDGLSKALIDYMGDAKTNNGITYVEGTATFSNVKRKSSKWGTGNTDENIVATAEITSSGAVNVQYSPDEFAKLAK